ncbi:MAG: hypothetical protein H6698_00890 [Myxococcales bacterium]|nr:hypothetical protein [Myxococcales bacterium]MCB9532867.1 hypothetical protein [Myxococcales bacterium]
MVKRRRTNAVARRGSRPDAPPGADADSRVSPTGGADAPASTLTVPACVPVDASSGLGWRGRVFVAFVLVQGLAPLTALAVPDSEARTDFTWDMFAVRRDCSPCRIWVGIGDDPPQQFSWGLAAPSIDAIRPGAPRGLGGWLEAAVSPPRIDLEAQAAFERFDALGRGALLVHPDRAALNVRAAPQVGRLRTRGRLRALGAELCEDFGDLYREVSSGEGSAPEWARQGAARWRVQHERLHVSAECTCRYNDGPAIVVADRADDLCAP